MSFAKVSLRRGRIAAWRFARALSLGVIATILACAEAGACRVWENMETTFFDEVPEGIEAPIIAQVTIIRIIPEPTMNLPAGRSFSGLARIKKVMRGALAKRVIRISAPRTSCNFPFSAGASGFVAGTLQRDDQHRPVLHLISESDPARAKRKGAL
jgi:hypothetical protein